jgi:hypothetical protein
LPSTPLADKPDAEKIERKGENSLVRVFVSGRVSLCEDAFEE